VEERTKKNDYLFFEGGDTDLRRALSAEVSNPPIGGNSSNLTNSFGGEETCLKN
jgi:hypothetical protein